MKQVIGRAINENRSGLYKAPYGTAQSTKTSALYGGIPKRLKGGVLKTLRS